MSGNESANSVPAWAEFFTPAEYNEFIEHVSAYFLYRGLSFKIGDGLVEVGENDLGYGQNGLDNIARTCKQIPRSEWEHRINFHFGALEKSHAFQKEIDLKKNSFEWMQQYISVRIFSTDYVNQVGEDYFIKKQIADDLVAALVFDYPDNIQNMKETDIEKWNKSIPELFELGEKNAKANNPLSMELVAAPDYSLYAVETNHFFAANIYFELDQLDFLEKGKGCLIAFPTRHLSIIYPIKDIQTVKVLNQIIPIVYNMNHDGAGPISNNVYWYVKGKLNRIPYNVENNSLTIIPSPEFIALLNSVAEK